MPRYQFDLTADVATATALVQLAMETATQFSFRIVEGEPMKVLPPHHKRNYIKGKTTHGEVFELCRVSANNRATGDRIKQMFARMGWQPNSIHTAKNRLISTGLFEPFKDGIRMLSDKTTLEQINAKLKDTYKAELERKSK